MADFWEGRRSAKGAEDFLALSKRLKVAGDLGLRKELHGAIRSSVRPTVRKVKAKAGEVWPRRGGLNRIMAAKKVQVTTATGARTAGVRVKMKDVHLRYDKGIVRHPVFGNDEQWVQQNVPGAAGFFSGTIEADREAIRSEIYVILADYAQRVTKGF